MQTAFTREELLQKLDAIESQYSLFYSIIYPELELERLEADILTESEIYEKVDSLLNAKHQGELLVLENVYNAAKKKKQELLADLETDYTSALEKSDDDYESEKEELAEDYAKRGMGKSSALAYFTGRLEEKHLEERGKIYSQYLEKKEETEKELDDLAVKYSEDLTTKQLEQLQEKIETVEQYKKQNNENYFEALKYNNQLTEKEREFAKANKDSILKHANEDTISQTSMMHEKLKLFNAYFAGCAPAEVVAEITADPIYKKYLGEYGFKIMRQYYEDLASIAV